MSLILLLHSLHGCRHSTDIIGSLLPLFQGSVGTSFEQRRKGREGKELGGVEVKKGRKVKGRRERKESKRRKVRLVKWQGSEAKERKAK